jgi:hypothetical protein
MGADSSDIGMLLRVGPTKRHLIREDGSPFFYLADTAWELVHRLKREEAVEYLDARAKQGFTAIQMVALAELDGLKDPNPYGERPLVGNNPMKPNDAYFDHVEWVVARAAERGLVSAVLPTWGDKVYSKWFWQTPTAPPPLFTEESARFFGAYLAKRLGKYPLIWVLGGDRPVETEAHRQTWRAMASALKAHSPHLVTYHPMGQHSSSMYFHNEPWLDFNMIQSGHVRRDLPTEAMVMADLALIPPKPTIESEVNYEDHPIWWKPDTHGWFDDFDVRKSAYRAVFSGSAGYTYGCHNVWQMNDTHRKPIAWARKTWRESLGLPGCNQMRHLRKLIESVPWTEMRPAPAHTMWYHELALGERAAAMATPDQQHILLYVPRGHAMDFPTVTTHGYRDYRWRVMDCRTGEFTPWLPLEPTGVRFPSEEPGRDFVLELKGETSGEFRKYWK